MGKKLYLMIIVVLFMISTIASLFSAKNNEESNLDIGETYEQEILDELKFDDGIKINLVKLYGDNYIAYGSKDEYPFMTTISQTEEFGISTNYTTNKGSIISVEDKDIYLSALVETDNIINTQDFFVSNNEIIPFYKKQLTINYSKGVTIKPKYIVIHETANTRAGADANAHYRYWSTNPTAKASTHFVVDSTQIYQMLELHQMAWHVGDNNKGFSDILNSNSIGIEISVNSDGNYEQTRQHTIELTIKIMRKLNMDISQLKRHYDASGKLDPITMMDNPELWVDFVNRVQIGIQK